VTEAIFGLLGVIVGGVLNAAGGLWSARRTESASAKAAARLLLHDLMGVAVPVDWAASVGEWGPIRQGSLPLERWTEYEGLFARAISSFDDWLTLWRVVHQVRRLTEDAPPEGSDAFHVKMPPERQLAAERANDTLDQALAVVRRIAADGTRPSVTQRVRRLRRRRRLQPSQQ
jgi:hypothetical protein